MAMTDVYHFRQRKDDYFKQDPSSPLAGAAFNGLVYYPVTEKYIVGASVNPFDGADTVELQTSAGDTQTYLRYAKVGFSLDDTPCTLTLFTPVGEAPGRVFIPFKDLTNGKETYGAGRYLEALLTNGKVRLDFNYAYNPYCAYSDSYRCPLPPVENHLKIPVRAGEKSYTGGRHAD